jgi:hypothetical protein
MGGASVWVAEYGKARWTPQNFIDDWFGA